MTTSQNDFQKMVMNVRAILAQNILVWTAQLAFAGRVTELGIRATAATNIEHQQALSIKGIALNKKAAKKTMANNALAIAGPLGSFAHITGNIALFDMVNFSYSNIYGAKASLAIDRSQIVYDQANGILAALATYGITAAKLALLQTAVTNFTNLEEAPQTALVVRQTYTADLDIAIKNISDVFIDLDRLMIPFKTTNLTFFEQYTTARKLPKRGSHKLSISGKVYANDTQTFIYKAVITLSGYAKIKKSSKKGGFSYKNLATGTYTLKATYEGYDDFSTTVYVNAGITSKVKITMIQLT